MSTVYITSDMLIGSTQPINDLIETTNIGDCVVFESGIHTVDVPVRLLAGRYYTSHAVFQVPSGHWNGPVIQVVYIPMPKKSLFQRFIGWVRRYLLRQHEGPFTSLTGFHVYGTPAPDTYTSIVLRQK